MDGGTITGIIQCCLAIVAIGVDVFLAIFAGRFVKDRKEKRAKYEASAAISDENLNKIIENSSKEKQNISFSNKKLKRQAGIILKKLKKRHKRYPEISAISMVIEFKKLYDGNESLIVRALKISKEKGYLSWSGEKLLPSTVITIIKNEEENLLEYLSSCKP